MKEKQLNINVNKFEYFNDISNCFGPNNNYLPGIIADINGPNRRIYKNKKIVFKNYSINVCSFNFSLFKLEWQNIIKNI